MSELATIIAAARNAARVWAAEAPAERWTTLIPDRDIDRAEQALGRPMEDEEAETFACEFVRAYEAAVKEATEIDHEETVRVVGCSSRRQRERILEDALRHGRVLCAYNDRLEDRRVGLTLSEALEISDEDPSLIYIGGRIL